MKDVFTPEVISQIIKLIAALAIAVFSFAVRKAAKSFAKKYNVSAEFEEMNNLEDYIKRVVFSCVQSTNQTFVDSLKKNGKFDSEKQKEAFELTYNAVYTIVEGSVKTLLMTDDLKAVQTYLTTLIEETVKMCKETVESNLIPPINVSSLMDSQPTFTTLEAIPDKNVYEFNVEPMNEEDITD
jgi:ABC-type multidrug transport system fused ATPase/permease subunit